MKQALAIFLLGLSITTNAINPERDYRFTPDMRGLNYSEYQVETIDGYKLNVWEYALPDSVKANRTVILVQPDAGNMGYMIWQAKALISKGLRVVAFDYRGFGHSQDFEIIRNYLFHHEFAIDLDSIIKATREKYPSDKIGLYSLSMGTYVSLLRKEKIEFMIAEGFYNDPQAVVDRIKENKGKTVLLPPDSKAIRRQKHIPILVFCADNDKITITADAKHFSKKNEVTVIEFKGDHLHGINAMTKINPGDEYADKIFNFLVKSGV